ncbi:MAG TPA: hypothetical protein ENH91_09650, partial [Leeuwenhoekiella sp.]|nr:hypothetical protein [Leeuwenhoekiella sp.]
MKIKNLLLVFFLTILTLNFAAAQEWQTPVIDGYGKVKYFKDAGIQPEKDKEYKILYHLTSKNEKEGVNAGLWHIARQVNLFGVTGVPSQNVKIVAVISGPDTDIVMSDDAYMKRYQKKNPNLDLMKKLTDYGVKIEVCGQAAAEHNIDPYSELNKYTDFTLSALIDIPTYQMQG